MKKNVNPLYSLLGGTLLATIDIVVLLLLVKNLGKKINPGKAVLLAFFIAGKLGFLGLAVFWMARAPWFDTTGAVVGLTFPFVILVLFQVMKNTFINKNVTRGN